MCVGAVVSVGGWVGDECGCDSGSPCGVCGWVMVSVSSVVVVVVSVGGCGGEYGWVWWW